MTGSENRQGLLRPDLMNKRILIAEDEFFVADEMALDLKSFGAEIVGPVSSLAEALDLLESATSIDAAVLDINLQGKMAYPLADALSERGVPFVFSTGYERWSIPPVYKSVPLCQKPVDTIWIAKALLQQAQDGRATSGT